MSELKIFENPEFGSIRTTTIDNEPWFVGKDVCEIFGDTNHSRSLSRLDDEDKCVSKMATPGGIQNMTIINESGFYSLLFYMQPHKPKGGVKLDTTFEQRVEKLKRFKRWVTSEVLPAIRKTGTYALPQSRQRDLTTDDYLKAAHIVSRCRNERLPYVINFLEQAGFYIPEVQQTSVIAEEDDGVNLVELLNRYPLLELCRILKLPKSALYYYRIGKYKPLPERRKYIIETLE